MSAFVVLPKPESEKIPVITAEELADALRAYIEATDPTFSYTGQDIEGSDETTYIYFYGVRTDAPSKRMKLVVTIYGKAAHSWQSKLFNMRFDVSICEEYDMTQFFKLDVDQQMAFLRERTRRLLIEPLADRSISISRILRWENGQPVVEV